MKPANNYLLITNHYLPVLVKTYSNLNKSIKDMFIYHKEKA